MQSLVGTEPWVIVCPGLPWGSDDPCQKHEPNGGPTWVRTDHRLMGLHNVYV
jgi:hypothetical protein